MSCLRAARTNETKVIDKLLKEERKQRKCKVLVLGAGDSGKSTFIKQLCLINYSRTSTEYQQLVTDTRVGIYSSIREGMRFLIDYTENCGLKIEDPELCEAILLVKNASYVDMKDQELLSAIKMLWSSETIKKICGTISSSIPCNLVYMLDHLDQYQQEGYEIQDDDILRVRIKTTGVHHYTINDVKNPPPWCFIDVGGQKSERRKWVHAFDDVVAVVYVSALDSFERVCLFSNFNFFHHNFLHPPPNFPPFNPRDSETERTTKSFYLFRKTLPPPPPPPPPPPTPPPPQPHPTPHPPPTTQPPTQHNKPPHPLSQKNQSHH
eukprot:TRINITY_DN2160_c1_g1_i1.p1 TRINITY_DN2160_c1_g1~~TRINITY_DN2160_c1_g1_i1.p1  ORF type:complete len:322 (+),score=53.14 TRINITY_DN2160_c1_g1_i1:60-1025(+)